MNKKAQAAADKIMLAFLDAGIVPLDVHQYALIDAHVRGVLARAMEDGPEREQRKRANFERVLAEGTRP